MPDSKVDKKKNSMRVRAVKPYSPFLKSAIFFLITGALLFSKYSPQKDRPMTQDHKYTNNLIGETSPYLLQHAHNPVYWFPWGEEALKKAREEGKPIFLSIGYAACHWCHVMERESFENEGIAKILNENFISIKVDREERPDLDEIYMEAVLATSGRGGWPMTVFLTSDLKPFFGGTYFPPEDKWGITGFRQLIQIISDKWKNEEEKKKLLKSADDLSNIIKERTSDAIPFTEEQGLDKALLDKAVNQIEASYDKEWGGFGSAPKFPQSTVFSVLFRDFYHSGNKKSLEMALHTLDKMYEGGMYDHLGGGFHRYSTDRMWLVPHFEKMLYDNAQLAVSYMEAFQLTGKKRYERVAHEIFDYVLTYMTDESGAFHSTEDADSEEKEGIFYLWNFDEIEKILGKEDAKIFSTYYSVQKAGNFSSHETYHKGLNILHIKRGVSEIAQELKIDEIKLEEKLKSIRKKLLEVRDRRTRPGLDDKIITSWNALMISAYARGYQLFDEKKYLQAAENAAAFIMNKMRTKQGKLLRIHRKGKSKYLAYLEDYSYTVQAFVDLYEAGFDEQWLHAASDFTEEMIEQFWDDRGAGFFNTSDQHKNLIARTKTLNDQAIPSPNAVAIMSLLRLSKLLDEDDYFKKAQKTLRMYHTYMDRLPRGYLSLLSCVAFIIYPSKEIALVGRLDSDDIKQLLRVVNNRFLPNRIIAFIDPDHEDAQKLAEKIPLLKARLMVNGSATAYVCENFTCKLPVTTPEALLKRLDIQ